MNQQKSHQGPRIALIDFWSMSYSGGGGGTPDLSDGDDQKGENSKLKKIPGASKKPKKIPGPKIEP